MKQDLLEILKNPNDKLIAVDLDGTICHGIFWGDESKISPNKKMIELIWKLYKGGGHIIIYTARQSMHYSRTFGWLIANNVPFHGIAMEKKPGADLYIDDLSLNLDDILL